MASSAQPVPRFFSVDGVAIRGFDPVGYFRQGRPVKGEPAFASEHVGFTFWHETDETRSVFESDPKKYAPQFGGYCAFAMSEGAIATTQPDAWTVSDVATVPSTFEVHGELLYLNYSQQVREKWLPDIERNVQLADRHWPGILSGDNTTQ